jgi:hypothetical protein
MDRIPKANSWPLTHCLHVVKNCEARDQLKIKVVSVSSISAKAAEQPPGEGGTVVFDYKICSHSYRMIQCAISVSESHIPS